MPASACLSAVSRWKPPKRSAIPEGRLDILEGVTSLVNNSLLRREETADGQAALWDARDHPGICPGTAGGQR